MQEGDRSFDTIASVSYLERFVTIIIEPVRGRRTILSRFAHMSDIHLGAHREPALRDIERRCFAEAMDMCIKEDVDFLLISGDLFHVGIPDLGVVNDAVRKMRELREARIPIYAIYGSHDYTPTGTSVIDILH